jgi:hypothetical protein
MNQRIVLCQMLKSVKYPKPAGKVQITSHAYYKKRKYHDFGNTNRESLKMESYAVNVVLIRDLFFIGCLYPYYMTLSFSRGSCFTQTTVCSFFPRTSLFSPILAENRCQCFAFVRYSYRHAFTYLMKINSAFSDSFQLCR